MHLAPINESIEFIKQVDRLESKLERYKKAYNSGVAAQSELLAEIGTLKQEIARLEGELTTMTLAFCDVLAEFVDEREPVDSASPLVDDTNWRMTADILGVELEAALGEVARLEEKANRGGAS